MIEHLIADPAERKQRAADKEEWVLDFLRREIYSSTAILAVEMGIGNRAALNVLNRMERKKLLVKDEVSFIKGRALPLWGITSNGVLEGLSPEDVATVSLRHHRVGSVSPVTIAHTLDVQRCSQYFEIDLDCEDWTPTRLLPAQNERKGHPKRWSVYPDGVVSFPIDEENFVSVAVEVERSRKSPERYVQIIEGHLSNIKKNRYVKVFYFCESKKVAENLEALFLRLMVKKKIWFRLKDGDDEIPPKEVMAYFEFNGMELF